MSKTQKIPECQRRILILQGHPAVPWMTNIYFTSGGKQRMGDLDNAEDDTWASILNSMVRLHCLTFCFIRYLTCLKTRFSAGARVYSTQHLCGSIQVTFTKLRQIYEKTAIVIPGNSFRSLLGIASSYLLRSYISPLLRWGKGKAFCGVVWQWICEISHENGDFRTIYWGGSIRFFQSNSYGILSCLQ